MTIRSGSERCFRAARLMAGLMFGLFALAAGAAQAGALALLWDRWALLLLAVGR